MDQRKLKRKEAYLFMRTYSIYIIRNTVNNKVYIGQTCQSVQERFCQHLKPSTSKQRGSYKIYNAMKKYGRDKFYVETLENGIKESEIDRKEIEYIEKFNSFENGYNSTPGGDGKTISKIRDIETFRILYYGGVDLKDIAKKFNVHVETVKRTAESLGLPKRNNKITREYLEKYADRKTNIDIAIEMDVDEYTVTRAFKKYGIKRGKGCNNSNNRQNQKQLNEYQIRLFKDLWMKKEDLSVMANIFEVHKRTLFEYARKLGLPKRRYISD